MSSMTGQDKAEARIANVTIRKDPIGGWYELTKC